MENVQKEKMYIDGQWLNAASGKTYEVINPATEEVIASVPLGGVEDVEKAIDAARAAFDNGPWPRMSPGERAEVILKLARMVEENKSQFSTLETLNTGKPAKQVADYDIGATIDSGT
jgi:aldehyde dehydrogenase (NAD+)